MLTCKNGHKDVVKTQTIDWNSKDKNGKTSHRKIFRNASEG